MSFQKSSKLLKDVSYNLPETNFEKEKHNKKFIDDEAKNVYKTGVLVKMPGKTFTEPGIVLRRIKEELESDNPSKCLYKYQLYYIDYTRRNEKGMLMSDKWMDPKALMKQGIETANEGRVSIKLGDKIRFQHDAANMIHIILPEQEMTTKQTFGNRREVYYNLTFNGVENPRFKYGSHIYYEAILVISDSQPPHVWTDMTGLYVDDSSSVLSLPDVFFNGNSELGEAPWYIGICPKCPIKVILKVKYDNLLWNQAEEKFDCDFYLELESLDSIQNFSSFEDNQAVGMISYVKTKIEKNFYKRELKIIKKEDVLETILFTLKDVPFIQEDMKRQNFCLRKPRKIERVRAIVTGKHTLLVPLTMTNDLVLRRSTLPIRITKRSVKGTKYLMPGDWVVCDLYLSPATPTWFAKIKYAIKDFDESEHVYSFVENRKFIEECTFVNGELDQELNMYYIEATDVCETSAPGFYYHDTLGLIYDRCYSFTKLESAWCVDVSEKCSIARLETIQLQPLLEKPLPPVGDCFILNSYGLVLKHRRGNTVLFSSVMNDYEILIPEAHPELQVGTFVLFDAVFFEERIRSKILRYYRVTHVQTLPNLPPIETREMPSPMMCVPTIEFKIRIYREKICEGVHVWYNSFLGPIEDPDCMLPLEPVVEKKHSKKTVETKFFFPKNSREEEKFMEQKSKKQKKSKIEREEEEMKDTQWVFVTKEDREICYQAHFRISNTSHDDEPEDKETIHLTMKEKDTQKAEIVFTTLAFEKEYPLPPWFKYDEDSLNTPLQSDEVNWEDFIESASRIYDKHLPELSEAFEFREISVNSNE